MRRIPDYAGRGKRDERAPEETARIKDELRDVGASEIIDEVFAQMEASLGPAKPPQEGDAPAPASQRRRTERGEEGDDTEPPPPLSAIALRVTDGAFLVSLEDADDRDLTGRTIVRCMVLNEEERAELLCAAEEAADDSAANIIGRLPKRKA